MPEWLRRLTKTDIRNSLAIFIVWGTYILLYIMLVKPIPPGNKDVLNTIVGFIFGGALAGVVGFYFGSSKTNARNDNNE